MPPQRTWLLIGFLCISLLTIAGVFWQRNTPLRGQTTPEDYCVTTYSQYSQSCIDRNTTSYPCLGGRTFGDDFNACNVYAQSQQACLDIMEYPTCDAFSTSPVCRQKSFQCSIAGSFCCPQGGGISIPANPCCSGLYCGVGSQTCVENPFEECIAQHSGVTMDCANVPRRGFGSTCNDIVPCCTLAGDYRMITGMELCDGGNVCNAAVGKCGPASVQCYRCAGGSTVTGADCMVHTVTDDIECKPVYGNYASQSQCLAACGNTPIPKKCSNNIDDDGDGKTDAEDPGCHAGDNLANAYDPNDDSESNPVACGNGVREGVEQCDDGSKNVPLNIASMTATQLKDNTSAQSILEASSCLATCRIAQCSDGQDNDADQATDNDDGGCHAPCETCNALATAYLKGKDSEGDLCQDAGASIAQEKSVFQWFAFILFAQVPDPDPALKNPCGCSYEFEDDAALAALPSRRSPSALLAVVAGSNCDGADMNLPLNHKDNNCKTDPPTMHCAVYPPDVTGTFHYQCRNLVDDFEACRTTRDCKTAYNSSWEFDTDTTGTHCIHTLNARPGGICCPRGGCGGNGSICPHKPASWFTPNPGGGGIAGQTTGQTSGTTAGNTTGTTAGNTSGVTSGRTAGNTTGNTTGTTSGGGSASSDIYSSPRSYPSSSRRSSSQVSKKQESSRSHPESGYCCDSDNVCRWKSDGCSRTYSTLLNCLVACSGISAPSSSAASVSVTSSSSVASGTIESSVSSSSGKSLSSRASTSSSSTSSSSSSSTSRSPSSGSSTPRSSSTSYNSSAHSSSQSSILVVGGICTGLECLSRGGYAFCANQDKTCQTTLDFPCLICVGDPSSSSRRSTSASSDASETTMLCTGNECADGAETFCGLQNMTCETLASDPCFRCIAPSSTSTSSTAFEIDVSSDNQLSSAMTQQCTTDGECSDVTRCVSGVCMNRTQIARLPAYCGNARLDSGEQCDDGAANSDMPNASCRANCTYARCGDKIVDAPLELCDDGNLFDGDGCASNCLLERTAPDALPAQVIQLPFDPTGDVTGGNDQATGGSSTVVTRPPANAGTGPAALIVMISGAAAGFSYMKRRRSGGTEVR